MNLILTDEQQKKLDDDQREKNAESNKAHILDAKQLRVDLDPILQRAKEFRDSLGRSPAARHASLSVTALEDAIMRYGMTLKELGTPNPYPNSRDTSNTVVDPTADGLKL